MAPEEGLKWGPLSLVAYKEVQLYLNLDGRWVPFQTGLRYERERRWWQHTANECRDLRSSEDAGNFSSRCGARKTGVNFINILRGFVIFNAKNLYEKQACKTLMKLTAEVNFINLLYAHFLYKSALQCCAKFAQLFSTYVLAKEHFTRA